MTRQKLIAGNWKMHGNRAMARELASGVASGAAGISAEMLICPPFPHLGLLGDLGPVALGAQDCHTAARGAHTGDVSAPMLRDLGCLYVILGHSERRADHGQTDAAVRARAVAAIAAGLRPIVCVGETLAQRDSREAEAVVRAQLAASLPEGFVAAEGVVAYEPVWAIGTGRTPTEGDITAMHAAMRAALVARFGEAAAATRLLYGGSVKPGNAAALLALPEVDGALVGGASLAAADFLAIARSA